MVSTHVAITANCMRVETSGSFLFFVSITYVSSPWLDWPRLLQLYLFLKKPNLPQQQSKMHSFWPTSAIYLPYTLHNRLPCWNLLECIEWSKIVNNSRHMQVWKTEQLLFVNMGFNRVNRLFNPMMFWICACHTLGFDWRPSIAAASTSPSHHVWNFLVSFFWQFQV